MTGKQRSPWGMAENRLGNKARERSELNPKRHGYPIKELHGNPEPDLFKPLSVDRLHRHLIGNFCPGFFL